MFNDITIEYVTYCSECSVWWQSYRKLILPPEPPPAKLLASPALVLSVFIWFCVPQKSCMCCLSIYPDTAETLLLMVMRRIDCYGSQDTALPKCFTLIFTYFYLLLLLLCQNGFSTCLLSCSIVYLDNHEVFSVDISNLILPKLNMMQHRCNTVWKLEPKECSMCVVLSDYFWLLI